MISIKIHNEISEISGLTPLMTKIVSKAISYFQPSLDEWRILLWHNSTFMTGLVGEVCTALKEADILYSIKDMRIQPKISQVALRFNGEERDYQNIENECIEATRGIIWYATGSGKTAVAARIMAKLGLKTLYIVPTKDLLHQTATDFERFLQVPTGKIGDGKFKIDSDIIVATIQTLYSVLKNEAHKRREDVLKILDDVDLLFIDEHHHGASESYLSTLNAIHAYYRFGLTGTAFREDGTDILLRASTGKVIARVDSSDLIKKNVLSKIEIKMFRFRDQSLDDMKLSWVEIYEAGIMRNNRRNLLLYEKIVYYKEQGRTILVIVNRIEHGETLQSMIQGSVFVHGSVASEERNLIREEFKDGKIQVLIASNIYDEGVDVPALDCLVIAGGGKSRRQTIQRVGRALRISPGKTEAVIIDLIDHHSRTLHKHSMQRKNTYKSESEFKVEII